jgi:hypothetical protein
VPSAIVAVALLGAPDAQADNPRSAAARSKPKPGRGVPELSAGAAAGAIVLVAGGALVWAGRRRSKA